MLILGILCCQQVIKQKAAKVPETLTALHAKKAVGLPYRE
jgi:hypothetical protein